MALGVLTFSLSGMAQQNYCDFDGMKLITFGFYNGVLDSAALNPQFTAVDSSKYCARYLRSAAQYDFMRLYPKNKLVDVTPYASLNASAPKITMKVYSTVSAGTNVILQLGIKSIDNFPAGIHSEYIAQTTRVNDWELLTFSYLDSPSGSFAQPANIDKIVLLFNPGSTDSAQAFYFDDPTGPPLVPFAVPGIETLSFRLYPGNPNPANERTQVPFSLSSAGTVSLTVYDLLGNPVVIVPVQTMKAGMHLITVDTSGIPSGIYFYTLRKDNESQTMKLVVSR